MGSKDPYAVQHFLRLKTQSLMARYAHLLPGHVRQAALTLDAQIPVTALDPPTNSVQQGETALISTEPLRNPNIA